MIIALTGRMGVGKSTAIEIISRLAKDKLGLDSELVKFAQPLYDMQEFIYNRIYPTHTRPSDFTKDRKLLQWLGTEWGRSIDQNLWVNLWTQKALAYQSEGKVVLCDDVRFNNEAQALHWESGYVIKMISAQTDSRIDTESGIKNHASENGVNSDLIDYVVVNDGSKLDLEIQLALICNNLFTKCGAV